MPLTSSLSNFNSNKSLLRISILRSSQTCWAAMKSEKLIDFSLIWRFLTEGLGILIFTATLRVTLKIKKWKNANNLQKATANFNRIYKKDEKVISMTFKACSKSLGMTCKKLNFINVTLKTLLIILKIRWISTKILAFRIGEANYIKLINLKSKKAFEVLLLGSQSWFISENWSSRSFLMATSLFCAQ